MAFKPSDPDDPVMADINVTPLVDVMLVLLIIFMIATPMLHQGIEVALPRIAAEILPLRDRDPVVLTLRKDGLIFIKEEPVHPSQIAERLLPLLAAKGDESVFLKVDKEVVYGKVAEILSLLHEAGIKNVGMVMEPPPR
jgi:biopolymer transport protein TolR